MSHTRSAASPTVLEKNDVYALFYDDILPFDQHERAEFQKFRLKLESVGIMERLHLIWGEYCRCCEKVGKVPRQHTIALSKCLTADSDVNRTLKTTAISFIRWRTGLLKTRKKWQARGDWL